jgi:hypothetical protein
MGVERQVLYWLEALAPFWGRAIALLVPFAFKVNPVSSVSRGWEDPAGEARGGTESSAS